MTATRDGVRKPRRAARAKTRRHEEVDKMVVRRDEAVALLEAVGFANSAKWDDDRVQTFLERIEEYGDAEDIADIDLKELFVDLTAASARDKVVELVAGSPRVAKAAPEEAPKPKARKRKEGVVSTVIDCLLKGSERRPVTKDAIHQVLVERFGPGTEADRDPRGMRNTLNGLTSWIKEPAHVKRGIKLFRSAKGFWATEG
jgi:hypothetical protein